jgi:hypothetical protein
MKDQKSMHTTTSESFAKPSVIFGAWQMLYYEGTFGFSHAILWLGCGNGICLSGHIVLQASGNKHTVKKRRIVNGKWGLWESNQTQTLFPFIILIEIPFHLSFLRSLREPNYPSSSAATSQIRDARGTVFYPPPCPVSWRSSPVAKYKDFPRCAYLKSRYEAIPKLFGNEYWYWTRINFDKVKTDKFNTNYLYKTLVLVRAKSKAIHQETVEGVTSLHLIPSQVVNQPTIQMFSYSYLSLTILFETYSHI